MNYAYISLYLALFVPLKGEPDSSQFIYDLHEISFSVQQKDWDSFNCPDIKQILLMGRQMEFECIGEIDKNKENTIMTAYIKMADGLIPMNSGMWSDRGWEIILKDCVYRGYLNITEEFGVPLVDPHRRDLTPNWPGFFITFDYTLWKMLPDPGTCTPPTTIPWNGDTCPPCPCSGTSVETTSQQSTTTGSGRTTSPSSSGSSTPSTTIASTTTEASSITESPSTSSPTNSPCPKKVECGPYCQVTGILFPIETVFLALYIVARNYKQLTQYASSKLPRSSNTSSDPENGSESFGTPYLPRVNTAAAMDSHAQRVLSPTIYTNTSDGIVDKPFGRGRSIATDITDVSGSISAPSAEFSTVNEENFTPEERENIWETESQSRAESPQEQSPSVSSEVTDEGSPRTEAFEESPSEANKRRETANTEAATSMESDPPASVTLPDDFIATAAGETALDKFFQMIAGDDPSDALKDLRNKARDERLRLPNSPCSSMNVSADFFESEKGPQLLGQLMGKDANLAQILKKCKQRREGSSFSSVEVAPDHPNTPALLSQLLAKDANQAEIMKEHKEVMRGTGQNSMGNKQLSRRSISSEGEETKNSSSSTVSGSGSTPSTSRSSTESQGEDNFIADENPYIGVDGLWRERILETDTSSGSNDDSSPPHDIRFIDNQHYGEHGGERDNPPQPTNVQRVENPYYEKINRKKST